MTYDFLQHYWWFIISLLGGLLVFLMFVQGGNAQIFMLGKTEAERGLIINSTGRKWEYAFTTLVTFGGAFFASFPLFYSTSFGGAYWVWMLILLTFVLQAVSYEFQHRVGNPRWVSFFRNCLVINGLLAPFLIGAAVSTFFTGSDFVVNKAAMGEMNPVISVWGNGWHGLEALADYRCWLFGLMLVALTMCLGILYMLNNISDSEFSVRLRHRLRIVSVGFILLFIASMGSIFLSDGYAVNADGVVALENYKYLHNLSQMPGVSILFLLGVLLVLVGLSLALFSERYYSKAVWPAGVGTVFTVMSLFFLAGYNGTAYYPSTSNIQSSLYLANSCSSEFTLRVMSVASLIIPFVLAYIVYAWRSIDRKPITREELATAEEKY
ncbi:MAG: cytochrome d ubiquinol oxidase subunit II [Bacteroidales bacterium]|nr:cytochrome d ubiquinol oxidase subunit II [Bacteroidales bacterium]